MPTYSYKCECGNVFDAYRSMVERETADCPKCGKNAQKDFAASIKFNTPAEFKPYFHYGLGVEVTSMKHLKQVCKEKGFTSPYADGESRHEKGVTREMENWNDRPKKLYA